MVLPSSVDWHLAQHWLADVKVGPRGLDTLQHYLVVHLYLQKTVCLNTNNPKHCWFHTRQVSTITICLSENHQHHGKIFLVENKYDEFSYYTSQIWDFFFLILKQILWIFLFKKQGILNERIDMMNFIKLSTR